RVEHVGGLDERRRFVQLPTRDRGPVRQLLGLHAPRERVPVGGVLPGAGGGVARARPGRGTVPQWRDSAGRRDPRPVVRPPGTRRRRAVRRRVPLADFLQLPERRWTGSVPAAGTARGGPPEPGAVRTVLGILLAGV